MTYMKDPKSAADLLFTKRHQLFLNFDEHTDQSENAILYLNTQLSKLASTLSSTSQFNYLDVGCGFGQKTLAIINTIQAYCLIKTIALDPSHELLSLFKNEISDQSIDLFPSTWEEYQPNIQFDFISSFHTFYYIDHWQFAISKMLDALKLNGQICIALRSIDPVCQFKDYFYSKIYDDRRRERNSDELCELLIKLNIEYQIDYVDSLLDIRDCLEKNKKGRQLLEFILRQPYEKLADFEDEIILYLKKIENNGYLMQRDAYIWISNQEKGKLS